MIFRKYDAEQSRKFDAQRRATTLELLDSFTQYVEAHPEERFWQALRNWSRYPFVFVGKRPDALEDTYYFEGLRRTKEPSA